MLWCGGTLDDKSEAFAKMINPPGQNQDAFSASDKDWPQVLDAIVYIATKFTFQKCIDEDPKLLNLYKEETGYESVDEFKENSIKALRMSDEEEPKEHMGFLMCLFGYESVLTREDFLQDMKKPECCWIYSAEKTRQRIKYFYPEEIHNEFIQGHH